MGQNQTRRRRLGEYNLRANAKSRGDSKLTANRIQSG